MVKKKRLKHPYFWLQCFFSTVQPVTVLEAICLLSRKRTKLHNKHFVYWPTKVGVFLHLILITIWVHTLVAAKAVKPVQLLSEAELLSVLCPGPHITLTAELHARLGAWCTWLHGAFVTSST